ncbi:MAG: hypothetical protein WKG07_20960 [Hymenobacter sp.]
MSDTTRDYLIKFWSLIDEILNAVLFLLIGLVVVTIPFDPRLIFVGLAAIPLVLAARAIAVMLPLTAMRPLLDLGPLAPPILIWGGLRGGISVALALSLPDRLSRSVETHRDLHRRAVRGDRARRHYQARLGIPGSQGNDPMRARLLRFANQLRESYWFVPTVMAVAALFLAAAMWCGWTAIMRRGGWTGCCRGSTPPTPRRRAQPGSRRSAGR